MIGLCLRVNNHPHLVLERAKDVIKKYCDKSTRTLT